MLVVKATVFSEQFLISYGDPNHHLLIRQAGVTFNTLAITLNVLLKAILRIHGMNI